MNERDTNRILEAEIETERPNVHLAATTMAQVITLCEFVLSWITNDTTTTTTATAPSESVCNKYQIAPFWKGELRLGAGQSNYICGPMASARLSAHRAS